MSNVLYPNKQEFDELIKNEKVLVDFLQHGVDHVR